MKITDYMHNAMTILADEFAARRRAGMKNVTELGRYWNDHVIGSDGFFGTYVDRPIVTLGVDTDDFLKMAGARKSSGANTVALVFVDGVIKWSKEGRIEYHYETNEDARFYQDLVERFPEYRKYLAETVQIGMFTVQETIGSAYENIWRLTDDERFDVYATLIRVAHELGLRDVHLGNWGFRDNDFTTPVIFDFSDRREPGSWMNWDRLNPQFDWNDWSVGRDYERRLERLIDDLNNPDDEEM